MFREKNNKNPLVKFLKQEWLYSKQSVKINKEPIRQQCT